MVEQEQATVGKTGAIIILISSTHLALILKSVEKKSHFQLRSIKLMKRIPPPPPLSSSTSPAYIVVLPSKAYY